MGSERLDTAFRQALALPESTDPRTTAFATTPEWDSIGHLQLLATIEEVYAITLTPDDVAEMLDYGAIRRILAERYGADA